MRLLTLAAVALSLVFALTVALELALPAESGVDPADVTGVRPASRVRMAPAAAGNPGGQPDAAQAGQWVDTILARPLFTRDRRPPNITTAIGAAEASELPRLTGVAITPDQRRAIFAGPPGGKPVVVDEGGSIAGFVIESITAGSVTVQGPDGEKTVGIAFDQGPPPSPHLDGENPGGGIPVAGQPPPGFPIPGVMPGVIPGVVPGQLPTMPFNLNNPAFGRPTPHARSGNGA